MWDSVIGLGFVFVRFWLTGRTKGERFNFIAEDWSMGALFFWHIVQRGLNPQLPEPSAHPNTPFNKNRHVVSTNTILCFCQLPPVRRPSL